MEEPLHNTPAGAVDWVRRNTDNLVVKHYGKVPTVVRIDANSGTVLILQETNGQYYWAPMREF